MSLLNSTAPLSTNDNYFAFSLQIIEIVAFIIGLIAFTIAVPLYLEYKVERSQKKFVEIRKYLAHREAKLNELASFFPYKTNKNFRHELSLDKGDPHVTVFWDNDWIPSEPVLLTKEENEVILSWDQEEEKKFIQQENQSAYLSPAVHDEKCIFTEQASKAKYILPYRQISLILKNWKYRRYSEAVYDLDKPLLFEDRVPTYRLLAVWKDDKEKYRLTFCRSWYFDFYDTCSVLGYEAAFFDQKFKQKYTEKIKLQGSAQKYRKLIDSPVNLKNRSAACAITVLTIFECVTENRSEWQFIMHERSVSSVAEAPGQFHLIPGMQFEPANNSTYLADFDLFRCIVREYGEEILGLPELNYTSEYMDKSPYKDLVNARKEELLKVFYLGVEINPLNLKPEIMIVCVFYKNKFQEIFKKAIPTDTEGTLIWRENLTGNSFDKDNVAFYCNSERTFTSARAILILAWKNRKAFGLP